jgi:LysR family transcriptional regulator, glycine cleavage system transcriptional activator
MKRTHLPLNGLRVLDAAARHLSFTRAADELAVTPAAVGQQIRALEDLLGVVLFRRTPKGLELTPEAQGGLPALRTGFLEFEEAVRAIQAGQSSRHLTIAAPRDFTAKWLQAALAAHLATLHDVSVTLVATDEALDFTEANLDLAICLAENPGAHEGAPLGEAQLVTVGRAGGGESAIIWPDAPAPNGPVALRVADAGLAIDAAAQGLGQATVPALLAAADIAAGRVTVIGSKTVSKCRYWLVAPLPQWRQAKVKGLVATLLAKAGQEA